MSKEMINFIGKQWARRSARNNAESVLAFVKGQGMMVVPQPLVHQNTHVVTLHPPDTTQLATDQSLSDSDDDSASSPCAVSW